MRAPSLVHYVLSAAGAITLLAGCSGNGSQVSPLAGGTNAVQSVAREPAGSIGEQVRFNSLAARQVPGGAPVSTESWMKRVDATQRLTYISQSTGGGNAQIGVFGRNAENIGTIFGLQNAIGLFVDGKRNLWVANYGGHQVLEFARGGTSPIKTLNDPNEYTYDVTICPNGTIYASNVSDTGSNPGSISVYAGGSINPTSTLTLPQPLYYLFLTCDAQNNVFSTFYNRASPGGGVAEFPLGSETGAHLLPVTSPSLTGIKPNSAGNLLINDWSGNTLCEYTEAGSPTGTCVATTGEWTDIAVTRDGKTALGISETNANGVALLWPSGTMRQTYKVPGSPNGVAFDPGMKGI